MCSIHRPPLHLDPGLPRPQYPLTTNRITSTEDADFMDASEIVIQTDAGYDPELNPDSDPPSDSESTKSNNSEAREVRRRWTHNEAPEDIRDFIPQPVPV